MATPSIAPLRTRRPGQYCWLDTAVILTYGPRIGAHAIAVYMVLVAHTNGRTQTCYPAINTIDQLTRLGRSTVKKALHVLRREKLIDSTPRQDPQGDPTSNLYRLLDPTPTAAAPEAVAREGGRSPHDPPSVTTQPTGRSPDDRKPTQSEQEERTSKPSDVCFAREGKKKFPPTDPSADHVPSSADLPWSVFQVPDDVRVAQCETNSGGIASLWATVWPAEARVKYAVQRGERLGQYAQEEQAPCAVEAA